MPFKKGENGRENLKYKLKINDLDIVPRKAGYRAAKRKKSIKAGTLSAIRRTRKKLKAKAAVARAKFEVNRGVAKKNIVNTIHGMMVFDDLIKHLNLHKVELQIFISISAALYTTKDDLKFFGTSTQMITKFTRSFVEKEYIQVVRKHPLSWSMTTKGEQYYAEILEKFNELTSFSKNKRLSKSKIIGKRTNADLLFSIPKQKTKTKIDDLFKPKKRK